MDSNIFCDSQIQDLSSFKCTMAECLYTCCANWSVLVDKDCLKKIKKDNPYYVKKFLKSTYLFGSDIYFKKKFNNVCRLLREDMSCDMHRCLGEEYLAIPCRKFPRIKRHNGFVTIDSLTLGCSEAARLILLNENGVHFDKHSDYSRENVMSKEEDIETFLNDEYLSYAESFIRHRTLYILHNKSIELTHRLGLISLMLDKAEEIELVKENDVKLQELLAYFCDNSDSISQYFDISRKITSNLSLQKHFDSWIKKDLIKQKLRLLPVKNKYSGYIKKLANSIKNKNDSPVLNHRHIEQILNKYSYILENYIAIIMYNTVFPYEHLDLHYAYKYLVLKFYMILVFISHLYKDADSISDIDIVFAISYYSRMYEHMQGRSFVFYEFIDNYGNFDLLATLSMLKLYYFSNNRTLQEK